MVGKGAIAIGIASCRVVLQGSQISSVIEWSVVASIPVSTHPDNGHSRVTPTEYSHGMTHEEQGGEEVAQEEEEVHYHHSSGQEEQEEHASVINIPPVISQLPSCTPCCTAPPGHTTGHLPLPWTPCSPYHLGTHTTL